jgi:hypothetical protein
MRLLAIATGVAAALCAFSPIAMAVPGSGARSIDGLESTVVPARCDRRTGRGCRGDRRYNRDRHYSGRRGRHREGYGAGIYYDHPGGPSHGRSDQSQ